MIQNDRTVASIFPSDPAKASSDKKAPPGKSPEKTSPDRQETALNSAHRIPGAPCLCAGRFSTRRTNSRLKPPTQAPPKNHTPGVR